MKKKRAFITGIAGFAGSYLAELLLSEGYDVFGLLAPREKTKNIKHLTPDIRLEQFDILEQKRLTGFIKKVKPDYLFHLAAIASVGQSFVNEKLTYNINFFGSLNILEAAKEFGRSLRKLVFISSADVYGKFKPKGRILKEDQVFNPISPYGISKAAAEYLAMYYGKHYGIPVVRVRPFNHTGPRQNRNFVVPAFCSQIAAIEGQGTKPEISVGDLSAKRDLSDVRDIISGYYLCALRGEPGEVYHLCSGRAVAIKTVLEKLLQISEVNIKVKVDKRRFRKSDIPVLKGDNTEAKKQLGWRCQYRLSETLKDTLQYWRNESKK